MKRLLISLLLAIALIATFVTPAFAGGPPKNNPGLETDGPGWWGLVMRAMLAVRTNWVPGVGMGVYTIDILVTDSAPPVKWQKGQWY